MMIEEGAVRLDIGDVSKISKSMDVFYNPVMKLNRDVSIEVIKRAFSKRKARVALPLAGSGIRAARFLSECPDSIEYISLNDYREGFNQHVKSMMDDNGIKSGYISSEQDAEIFLLLSDGFDYIDIDPFGTPNPFLDPAVKRIAREGILAVTATDTSALAGTYIGPCKRKYGSIPMRNWLKHVVGLRILIRKVQLSGAQYEKALYPVFSYSKDHYYRVFFRCKKGKKLCDEILKKHEYLVYDKEELSYGFSKRNTGDYAGPLYSGELWDKDFSGISLIEHIPVEASFEGKYIDIHEICKKKSLAIPRFSYISDSLRERGFKCSRTHFMKHGMKTDAPMPEIIDVISSYKA